MKETSKGQLCSVPSNQAEVICRLAPCASIHERALFRTRPGRSRESRALRVQEQTFEDAFMAVTRIDCDIHPAVGGTRTTLLPYLDDHWKEQVVSRAIDGLDLTSYPPNMPLSGRPDWRPKAGKPGSDLKMVQRGAFEQLGASHAICNVLYGAQAVYDPYMASAFCKAINDWIAAEWLSEDERLRASIVVPMQAPDLAVEEIERRASDNRFVSILVLAQGETLLGRRHFWPVYQAAEKYKLPLAIHAGSAYRFAPSSIGWPSHRYEYYFVGGRGFRAKIRGLFYGGVFAKS